MNTSYKTCRCVTVLFLLIGAAGCGGDDTGMKERSGVVFKKANEAFLRGDYQESKRLLRESAQLFGHLDDLARLAETSLLLGKTYAAGAEFDSAFTFFNQAQALYRSVSDREGSRAVVKARAAAHRIRCEENEAHSILNEQLRLEEVLGDVQGVRQMKWELVPVCRALGDGAKERRLLNELSDEYTAADDHAKLAAVQREFGESFLLDARISEAQESFSAALSHAERSQDTLLTIQIFMRLAVVYDRLGKQHESFQMFTEGLRRTDMIRGADGLREEMLLRVGNIYLRKKQYDEARRFLNASLRSSIRSQNRLLEAYALLQLGHCQSESGKPDAITYYTSANDLVIQIGLPWAIAYAQTCLGIHEQKQNRLTEALAHFSTAASSLDSSLVPREEDLFVDCENTFYQPQNTSPYDALIEMLFQLGKTEEGFLAAQNKQQRAFLRVFNAMHVRTGNPKLDTAFDGLALVRNNSIGAERQLAGAFTRYDESIALAAGVRNAFARERARWNELRDSLGASHPHFLMQSGLTFAEAQERVPDGSALVAYIPTSRSMQVVIVGKGTAGAFIAPVTRQALHELMHQFGKTLQQAAVETNRTSLAALQKRMRHLSAQLHRFFIRPVELNLQGVARLLLLLPEDLPIIPLHALQQEGRGGEFAIQRYSMKYLPDAGSLALKSKQIKNPPVVIGFGNQGRTSVDVEYDVRDAKSFFKDSKLLFNREATLDRLRNERGDLLHAAFELQYRRERPGNSFFVLSDGTGYASARYYRLGELFSIPPFSTIFFSNPIDADFHPWLPKSFLMNGTTEILVNSFVPPRKGRKLFNELFYTQLLAGTATEMAYRNAVLEMIKREEFSSPHMWAAFWLW